jgi:competence protein ComFC
MLCISCQKISFKIICKNCQKTLLKPNFNKRQIDDELFVYSFYSYEELQDLLHTKYEFFGDRVFNILAYLSFKKFSDNFKFNKEVFAIPIDDHTRNDFSQTAILTKYIKSSNIKPIYGTLKAKSKVKYAGKDLEFRKKNRRNFIYKGKSNLDIILVDDLITTGLTLLEAKKKLNQYKCKTIFALTLCDAKF